MNKSQDSVLDILKRGFEGFKGKDTQGHIQELMDRDEIRELAARYAQRVSQRLSMADMFTADGALVIRMPGQPVQKAEGREQLEQAFNAAITRPALSMPAVHNYVVSVSGDDAIATSWIELYTLENGERKFTGCGYYDDRLRRENGRWKFVVRDCTVVATGSTTPTQYAPTK